MVIQDLSKKVSSTDQASEEGKPNLKKTKAPASTAPEKIEMQDRYADIGNNIVKDTKTGLEWIAGPDEDTTWDEAESWVADLKVDGGGWRMPTEDELENIHEEGLGDRNMRLPLKTTGWDVWAGETEGPSQARGFSFFDGERHFFYRGSSDLTRGFAVRSRNDG